MVKRVKGLTRYHPSGQGEGSSCGSQVRHVMEDIRRMAVGACRMVNHPSEAWDDDHGQHRHSGLRKLARSHDVRKKVVHMGRELLEQDLVDHTCQILHNNLERIST